jgi:hypothetical protein
MEPLSDERAARYSDLFGEHEHASDCAYCPICATIAVVRNTKPEVLDHLASAARELIAAVGLLLEEAESVIGTAEAMRAEEQKKARVRKIDIG